MISTIRLHEVHSITRVTNGEKPSIRVMIKVMNMVRVSVRISVTNLALIALIRRTTLKPSFRNSGRDNSSGRSAIYR